MPGEKQPQSIWWNPTNSRADQMFSEKNSTNKRPVAPCWWTTSSTASSGKPFQQSILRSPVATQLICLDLRHSPQIWKPRLLLFRGFSIRPISIFSKQNKGQSGSGASLYDIHTYYLCIFCVYEFTVYIYIYIYYIYTWPLYTHFYCWFLTCLMKDCFSQGRHGATMSGAENPLPLATPPGRYVEDLELPGQKQDKVTYPVFVG